MFLLPRIDSVDGIYTQIWSDGGLIISVQESIQRKTSPSDPPPPPKSSLDAVCEALCIGFVSGKHNK